MSDRHDVGNKIAALIILSRPTEVPEDCLATEWARLTLARLQPGRKVAA